MRRKRNIKNKVMFVFLMCVFILGGCSAKDELTSASVEKMFKEQSVLVEAVGGIDDWFVVENTSNFLIEEDDEDVKYVVYADATLVGEEIEVDVRIGADVKCEDEQWIMDPPFVEEIYDVRPVKGVEEDIDLIKVKIQELYPEIKWGYQYEAVFSADINYDFPVSVELVENETDLVNKKDTFLYKYSFSTYTATIDGEVEVLYEFDDVQGWQLISVNGMNEKIVWNLIGVWSFDIYTNYIDVSICEFDYDIQRAKVKRQSSSFSGAPAEEILDISFYEEDNVLYFDTITIPGSSTNITLVARLGDMYYKCPSMFSGEEDIEMPTGGKSGEIETSETNVNRTVLSSEEIDTEVTRINNLYERYEEMKSNNEFVKVDDTVLCDIYYEGDSLRWINIPMKMINDYEVTIVFENDEIVFAYYDGPKEENYLYLRDGELIRWIYEEKLYGETQNVVFYDCEFDNSVFLGWETQVQEDVEYCISQALD